MDDGNYIYPGQMGPDDASRIDYATGMPIGSSHHYGGWFREHDHMAFADNDPMAAMYGMAPDPYEVYGYGGHSSGSSPSTGSSYSSSYDNKPTVRRDISDEAALLLLLFHNS